MRKKRKKTIPVVIALLLCAAACVAIVFAVNKLKIEAEHRIYPLKYQELVEAAAAKHGVPASLIFAVIKTESGFNPNALSNANAKGLMQITDDTFDWLRNHVRKDGKDLTSDDLFKPEINIDYGVSLLSYLYGDLGSWENALAAYNAGRQAAKNWLSDESLHNNGTLIIEKIPYAETRKYVQKVLDAQAVYERLYFADNP